MGHVAGDSDCVPLHVQMRFDGFDGFVDDAHLDVVRCHGGERRKRDVRHVTGMPVMSATLVSEYRAAGWLGLTSRMRSRRRGESLTSRAPAPRRNASMRRV
jgi:hypothetical protein